MNTITTAEKINANTALILEAMKQGDMELAAKLQENSRQLAAEQNA